MSITCYSGGFSNNIHDLLGPVVSIIPVLARGGGSQGGSRTLADHEDHGGRVQFFLELDAICTVLISWIVAGSAYRSKLLVSKWTRSCNYGGLWVSADSARRCPK